MNELLELGTAIPVSGDRRRGPRDRRQTPRGGRRASDFACIGVLTVACAALSAGTASAQAIGFGFDANSAARAKGLGMPVSYGSVWAGAWNQERYGWDGIRWQLEAAKNAGATPVIQWWYWGDDLSPTCVESGCRDQYYGVWKDKATWDRLSNDLADVIVQTLGPSSGALIVVETEFNKASMQRNDTFDAWLAEKAAFFRARGLRVIVGFGNWSRENWGNYPRAIASADLMGVMALQSSVRDGSTYLSGADMLIGAAQHNQRTFGKASFVTDFAFSSYPEPGYELYQDTVVRDIFRRRDELRAAGVQGMVWRMLADDPNFNTANYHGMAERFWGLLHADGSPKMAFQPFLNGMLDEVDYAREQAAAASSPTVVVAASPAPTISAPLRVTGVTANLPSPLAVGTTMTFTAAADGGTGSYEYRWWLFDGSTWAALTGWTTSNTHTWTAPAPHDGYRVGVWARRPGSTADAPDNAQATGAIAFVVSAPASATVTAQPVASPLRATGFTVDRVSPQPARTTIGFAVDASGGTAPYQYKWWVFDGTTWSPATGWTSSGTFGWTPASPNADYRIGVWVRSAGSTADAADSSEAITWTPYVITAATSVAPASAPLVVNALTSDRPTTLPVGTPVTITVNAAGGVAPYQYKWWLFDGTTWAPLTGWTTSGSYRWTAPAAKTYRIGVWVRSDGSSADAADNSAANGVVTIVATP